MIDAELLKGLPPAEAERVLALGKRLLLTAGAELSTSGDRRPAALPGRAAAPAFAYTLPMQVRHHEEDILVEECSSGQPSDGPR